MHTCVYAYILCTHAHLRIQACVHDTRVHMAMCISEYLVCVYICLFSVRSWTHLKNVCMCVHAKYVYMYVHIYFEAFMHLLTDMSVICNVDVIACVCVYAYEYAYMYMYMCMICPCARVCKCIRTRTCICICMGTRMHVCVYMCKYMYMH